MKNFKRKESLKEAGIITVDEHCVPHSKQNLQQAGITLVALVVTIIVLLILAGVTITLALSNNGVIGRAQHASNSWANATKDEDTAMAGFASDVDTLTAGFIDREGGSGGGSTGTALKIGGTDLSTVSDLSALYGQTVSGFSANSTTQAALDTEGITWQLFYDDASNYYLIASDYVPNATLVATGAQSELIKSTNSSNQYATYCATFGTYSSGGYTGKIMETTPWSNGKNSSTITGNGLTSAYLQWVGSGVDTEVANENMKAVAYMMDTDKWSNFAGTTTGATAMGGPTLEMFVKSYNAKHTDKKISTYDDGISSANANSNGYLVKWESDGTWKTGIGDLETGDTMWVKADEKASGMWLATPSSNGYDKLRQVSSYGGLYSVEIDERLQHWVPSGSFNPKILNPTG